MNEKELLESLKKLIEVTEDTSPDKVADLMKVAIEAVDPGLMGPGTFSEYAQAGSTVRKAMLEAIEGLPPGLTTGVITWLLARETLRFSEVSSVMDLEASTEHMKRSLEQAVKLMKQNGGQLPFTKL